MTGKKGTVQMPATAIIFDLDGLMIRSEPVAFRVWAELVEGFGKTFTSDEYRLLIGGTPRESANRILNDKQLELDIEALLERYWSMRTERVIQEANLEPGLEMMLVDLRKLGVLMAVASNSRASYLEAVLKSFRIREFFNVVRSSDDVERGKPAPDIYIAAAHALGQPPEKCIVLEDSPIGLSAAVSAGMRCVVVPNHELSDADYSSAYAMFASLHEVHENLAILLG